MRSGGHVWAGEARGGDSRGMRGASGEGFRGRRVCSELPVGADAEAELIPHGPGTPRAPSKQGVSGVSGVPVADGSAPPEAGAV